MYNYTHQIKYLSLENYNLSIHELADVEDQYNNDTISYTSDRALPTKDLVSLLEEAVNQDRPAYAQLVCTYAEFPMIQSDSMSLNF